MTNKDIDYTSLTPKERILLAQELWDSVAHERAFPQATPEQQAEIKRRAASIDAGKMGTTTWPEVKARLLSRR
jgi:putative addiction module component (TIGR02574 family)